MIEAPEGDAEYTTTIVSAVVYQDGRMVNLIVYYNGESFFSRVAPLDDISSNAPEDGTPKLYEHTDWLTTMVLTSDGLVCGDVDGDVHIQTEDGWKVEHTGGETIKAMCADGDGNLWVVGTDGFVRRRTDDGWTTIGEGFGVSLNGIACDSDGQVLVAGDNGTAAIWDGGWSEVNVSTSARLNAAHSDGSGRWLLCGAAGTLFRGDSTGWTELGDATSDLFGFAEFQGATWVAAGTAGVAMIDESGDVVMKRETFAARAIHAQGTFIAFAGNDICARFDTQNWAGRRYQ